MKRILIALFFIAIQSPAGARPFTNQKGQSIEGSIVGADATNVTIMKGDGQRVTVPLKMLSEADQKFCTEWRVANPEIKLTVKADAVTAAGTRKSGTAQGGGGDTVVMERNRESEAGYRITVSNWSKEPGTKVSGLTVHYAIVVGFSDTSAKVKRGVKEIVRGSAEVPELTGSKPQSVLTQTAKIAQSAALAVRSTTDSNGDSHSSEAAAVYRESIDGICMVVKQGERVLSTYQTGKVPKELPAQLTK